MMVADQTKIFFKQKLTTEMLTWVDCMVMQFHRINLIKVKRVKDFFCFSKLTTKLILNHMNKLISRCK